MRIAATLICGICSCLLQRLPAQEPITPRPVPPAKEAPATPAARPAPRLDPTQLAAAMTESMRLSTPSEQHRRLTSLVGKYDVAMTLTAPNHEPEQCTGLAAAASVLGGRYLVLDCSVAVQQARLQGIYFFGFDNLHSLYTVSWRDSMSTWSVECSGSESPEHKDRIDLAGTMVDAATPTGRPFRMQLTLKDEGFEIAVLDTIGGDEKEVVRQRFTRRAADATPATPDAAPAPKAEPKPGK